MDNFVGGAQWPVARAPSRIKTGLGHSETRGLRSCRRHLWWMIPASRSAESVMEGPFGTSTGSQTRPKKPKGHNMKQVAWIGASGVALLTTASKGWSRRCVRRSAAAVRVGGARTQTRHKNPHGGRFQDDEHDQGSQQDFDRNRPPPNTGRKPKTGAWSDEVPESENMRQGQFKSPWTGQVYDRWVPDGLKQKSTDRQGGLGRSRAFETPTQQELRTEPAEKEVPEWQKYYPGLAPQHLMPQKKNKKVLDRHAFRAGSFSDIFKQLVVSTIADLKVKKSETPIWYVETCAGEGEYHVSRMKGPNDERRPLQWPTSENLYEALSSQDMTYMPLELRHWAETVQMLNSQEDFEVKGENVSEHQSIQWLPSTALMALRLLRKQDAVSLYEDNHVPFAALFNFTRNFASQVAAPLEIAFADGFKMVDKIFITKRKDSKQHGKLQNRRGLVVMDPDYKRGSEAFRCNRAVVALRKHWYAATTMVFYPIRPELMKKAKRFINEVRQADKSLDLLKVELYVETPDWDEWSDSPKWRGCGVLISSPPYTAGERIQACLTVLAEELGALKGGDFIHVKVEKVR